MVDRFQRVTGVFASAVANNGTLTVAYPGATTQRDFEPGFAGPNGYAIIAGNDKWTVALAQVGFVFGASNITVTNTSAVSWAAGSTYDFFFDQSDGQSLIFLNFHVKLAKIAAADVVTKIQPGVAGVLEAAWACVTDPATTGSKLATLTFGVGETPTPTTGGVMALTSANMTPLGAVVNATDFTAGNVLTPSTRLSLTGSAVTAFVEGEIDVVLRIRKTAAYEVNGSL